MEEVKIIGRATTKPITGTIYYPPAVYDVVSIIKEGDHLYYVTTAKVTDYEGDPGYPLWLVDFMVEKYEEIESK